MPSKRSEGRSGVTVVERERGDAFGEAKAGEEEAAVRRWRGLWTDDDPVATAGATTEDDEPDDETTAARRTPERKFDAARSLIFLLFASFNSSLFYSPQRGSVVLLLLRMYR
mmetsp:Transcript_6886/g.20623  ORF Transcript_6886/g.20623 Transcript_6886/m.20623 type:complete len:112 (-) Transcript_6886:487-822(-)